jgi:MFS transporter, DHA1 family, multidrug resistance protein
LASKLVLAALAAVMAVSTDLYLSGIPALVQDLGGTDSQGQLTLSVFLIGFALGQIVYGGLSDQWGRKPALFIGLAIYGVASLACAVAVDMETLIAARFLQGLGGAAGPVVARAIVADSYDRLNAARMMATIAGAMAIVPAIAPVLGSWLLYFFDWRAQFVALLILGLITVAGVTRLRETCPSIGRSPLSAGTLLGQFPLCLGSRNFLGYSLCGGAAYAAMFCYMSTTSFIMIELLGVRPEWFGYTALIVCLGYIAGATLGARQVVRRGTLTVLGWGQLAGLSAAAILLVLTATETYALAPLLLAYFLVFLAGGLCLALSQMGAIAELPEAAGKGSSVFGFLQLALASALGSLVGLFYDQTLLSTALGISAASVCSLVGFVLVKTGSGEPSGTATP